MSHCAMVPGQLYTKLLETMIDPTGFVNYKMNGQPETY